MALSDGKKNAPDVPTTQASKHHIVNHTAQNKTMAHAALTQPKSAAQDERTMGPQLTKNRPTRGQQRSAKPAKLSDQSVDQKKPIAAIHSLQNSGHQGAKSKKQSAPKLRVKIPMSRSDFTITTESPAVADSPLSTKSQAVAPAMTRANKSRNRDDDTHHPKFQENAAIYSKTQKRLLPDTTMLERLDIGSDFPVTSKSLAAVALANNLKKRDDNAHYQNFHKDAAVSYKTQKRLLPDTTTLEQLDIVAQQIKQLVDKRENLQRTLSRMSDVRVSQAHETLDANEAEEVSQDSSDSSTTSLGEGSAPSGFTYSSDEEIL
ncbi:hypothetical protein P7C71_g1883, partial [Lecanoromycetidae sp. Uapishka_2]